MSAIPFGEVRAWVFQDALPFWAAHGVDPVHGGFLEELSPMGAETSCAFKRVRVLCRQTYVFSHAALLGWPGGEALSRLGYEYLLSKARLPDGSWARMLSREGAVIDAAPDLYDISFVLYAMAWRYRASHDPEALRHAHAVLDFIQMHMRGPHAGFWHKMPPEGPRLQNPHMHLTEACLAAFEASGDQRFLDQAGELVTLLRTRLFNGVTLGERFNDDWTRAVGAAGRELEAGHHFEWAWILTQFQRLKGVNLAAEAAALTSFAERYGVDPLSQAVSDRVRDDGMPLRDSSRAWTNTERIKAWLALYELTGVDPRPQVTGSLRLLFDRYFQGVAPGAWIDQFDGEGKPMVEVVPASIVYHLMLAFTEVLRLEPKLTIARAPS